MAVMTQLVLGGRMLARVRPGIACTAARCACPVLPLHVMTRSSRWKLLQFYVCIDLPYAS